LRDCESSSSRTRILDLTNQHGNQGGHFLVPPWSCRNRALGKTKPCLFRLFRGELASAKWTGVKARRHVTHQHGRALPLDRHLRANGAGGSVGGRGKTEKTCPSRQPLVKSLRAVTPYWPRILRQSRKKGQ